MKKKKSLRLKSVLAVVVSLALVFTLSACKDSGEAGAQTAQSGDFAISFTDDDGNQINLSKPCEKIISLYSAHTENLFSIGAGESLIGASSTSIYPPEAAFLPRFDYKGDPETVIAAEPDAVLIRPFVTKKAPEFVSSLKKAGITVISLYPNSLDDFDSYIETLGKITGKEDNAKKALEEFWQGLDEVKAKTALAKEKQSIFFESTETNLRTVTEDSLAGMAMEFAGGENVAKGAKAVSESSSIASFGAEKVLELADDIDVYVSQRGAMNSGGNEHSISIRPGFDTIKAIKEGKILLINEKLISSPTFRYVKGVTELARFMYPELMDDLSAFSDKNKPLTKADLAEIIVKGKHLPIFAPSSSKYYNDILDGKKVKSHLYGLFEDIAVSEKGADYIETAVNKGAISYEEKDGKEFFNPNDLVTRDDLAKAIFILSELPSAKGTEDIADLGDCENQRIVQSVVEGGLMKTKDGKFLPKDVATVGEALEAICK